MSTIILSNIKEKEDQEATSSKTHIKKEVNKEEVSYTFCVFKRTMQQTPKDINNEVSRYFVKKGHSNSLSFELKLKRLLHFNNRNAITCWLVHNRLM
jgi:hypothetical protein